ncbi:MAG: hypothetical protein AAGU02_06345, partial [Lawsonibacter sp.]
VQRRIAMSVFKLIRHTLSAGRSYLRTLIAADVRSNRLVLRRVPVPAVIRSMEDGPRRRIRR